MSFKIEWFDLKGRLYITLNNDLDGLDKVKKCPDGRRYIPSKKSWAIPITIDNLKHLQVSGFGDFNKKIKDLELSLKKDFDISRIVWPVKPFKHQKEGLKLLLSNNKVALFWEQGTGKTLPIIKMIEILKRDMPTLVICPKSVVYAWKKQLEDFSSLSFQIISGDMKKRKKQLEVKANVYIMNYDLLISMAKHLMKKNFEIMIFDESHYLKNPSSQRSKLAYKIAKYTPRVFLLTGTPIGKDASDIFSQYKVLDRSIFGPSFTSFRYKYFQNVGWGNIPDWQIKTGYEEIIKSKIKLRSQRVLKTDVLDLPDKLYQTRLIEMTPEQARIYRDIKRKLKTDIENNDIAVRFLVVKLMKLNQIASGFIYSEGNVFDVSDKKTKELKEILEATPGPVVVWTVFKNDIKKIKKQYPEALEISGDTSLVDREKAINDFQNNKSKLIVLQIQAGSTGLTLTASSTVVFYSHDYNLLNRLQAEDRTHRIGQNNNVTYIDLVTENSIEIEILKNLESKRLKAGYFQGDISIDVYRKHFKSEKIFYDSANYLEKAINNNDQLLLK